MLLLKKRRGVAQTAAGPCQSEHWRSRGGSRTAPARARLKRCGVAGTLPYPCHSERLHHTQHDMGWDVALVMPVELWSGGRLDASLR